MKGPRSSRRPGSNGPPRCSLIGWIIGLIAFILLSTFLLIQNHIIEGPKTLSHIDEMQGLTKLLSSNLKYQDSPERKSDYLENTRSHASDFVSKGQDIIENALSSAKENLNFGREHTEVNCNDDVWCHVPPPEESYYGFDGPIDMDRWKIAQKLASEGANVFIERIVKVHTSPYYYIDGDRIFRNLQPLVDIFTDLKTGLDPLLPGNEHSFSPVRRRRLGEEASPKLERDHRRLPETIKELETTKALSVQGRQIVPSPYNYRVSDRAPIVEMGYTAFEKNMNTYFSGNFLGGNFVKREWWFNEWSKIKDRLDFPFITMCSLNENWGPISTNFPNRTAGWGACCNKKNQKVIHPFDKTSTKCITFRLL